MAFNIMNFARNLGEKKKEELEELLRKQQSSLGGLKDLPGKAALGIQGGLERVQQAPGRASSSLADLASSLADKARNTPVRTLHKKLAGGVPQQTSGDGIGGFLGDVAGGIGNIGGNLIENTVFGSRGAVASEEGRLQNQQSRAANAMNTIKNVALTMPSDNKEANKFLNQTFLDDKNLPEFSGGNKDFSKFLDGYRAQFVKDQKQLSKSNIMVNPQTEEQGTVAFDDKGDMKFTPIKTEGGTLGASARQLFGTVASEFLAKDEQKRAARIKAGLEPKPKPFTPIEQKGVQATIEDIVPKLAHRFSGIVPGAKFPQAVMGNLWEETKEIIGYQERSNVQQKQIEALFDKRIKELNSGKGVGLSGQYEWNRGVWRKEQGQGFKEGDIVERGGKKFKVVGFEDGEPILEEVQ